MAIAARETDMNHIVNKNENHYMAWAGMGDRANNARYAVHIPAANYLIDKYCKHWWKNHSGEWDYQFLQYKLCMELENLKSSKEAFQTRDFTIWWCAMVLGVSQVLLFNDPDLPF